MNKNIVISYKTLSDVQTDRVFAEIYNETFVGMKEDFLENFKLFVEFIKEVCYNVFARQIQ